MSELPEFILASRSPRRRDLLKRAHYRFRVVPPTLPEPPTPAGHVNPRELAEALAYFKARSVRTAHPGAIVLGADTVVARSGRIFGKANDEADARRTLRELSGTAHEVITALAMLLPGRDGGDPTRLLAAETTRIVMRELGDEEIARYVDSGEWRDKAGAYAVQETGDAFIDHIDGSFSNVVGLPMELLERLADRADRAVGEAEE